MPGPRLTSQPAWSDFPLVVLTPGGTVSPRNSRELESVGHMTLIKRPVRIVELVSTIRTALRDRRRQYETRDDLVERERQSEALRQSEAELRQLADAMPQIVWTAQANGFIDYYNRRWYEFTGFAENLEGRQSWEVIVHRDEVQHCRDTWSEAVRTGEPYDVAYRFKDRTTGGHRWHLCRALPVRDKQGRIIKWFGTCTDIDAQKQSEEAAQTNRAASEPGQYFHATQCGP